jgi:hypothetical protein
VEFLFDKRAGLFEKQNAGSGFNLFIYHTTLAALTLILLFFRNVEISK